MRGTRSLVRMVALFSATLFGAYTYAQQPVVEFGDGNGLDASYESWKDVVKVEDGALRFTGQPTNGGVLRNVQLNLTESVRKQLKLSVRKLAGNTAPAINVMLADGDGTRWIWRFDLEGVKEGEWTEVLASDGLTLNQAGIVADAGSQPGLDLSKIIQWHVQGLFLPDPSKLYNLEVRSVGTAAKPRADISKLTATPRGPMSPVIERVSLVAPDVVAVEIRAGKVLPATLSTYTPKPGDKLVEQPQAGSSGKSAFKEVQLVRDGKEMGWVIGPKRDHLVTREGFEGDDLQVEFADHPETWTVTGPEGAAVAVIDVYRKSKPFDWQMPTQKMAMMHTVYLRLAGPAKVGAKYTLGTGKLNTKQATFEFSPGGNTRSEAVKVNQIGFRPDDPLKRGFLSIWLGTGGSYSFSPLPGFAVVEDKTGKEVFRGKAEVSKLDSDVEKMWKDENFNYTSVYKLDFTPVTAPGEYRLVVDGVGSSYPFTIGRDAWKTAFTTQMRGFLNQRSGMKLGPPFTEFNKPVDYHPAPPPVGNGDLVVQSTHRQVDGGEWSVAAPEKLTTTPVPGAWGGWHDAGDWNPRRVSHMESAMAMMELMELAPDHFAAMKWNLPPTPQIDGYSEKLPDMLKEVLWELDLFRRLQREDGAASYGIESDGDPLAGEVSWLQTMRPTAVWAPDYNASYLYAMNAARFAKVVKRFDPALAEKYQASALKAMNWAERDWADFKGKKDWTHFDTRNLAAAVVYDLTGDEKWHKIFLENSVLTQDAPKLFAWGTAVQRNAAFVYARLPEGKGDKAIKAKAKAALLVEAEKALVYGGDNAWGLTTADKGKPMFLGFYSIAEADSLVRAHVLTGEEKYLAGVVRATLFSLGANPANQVFTTGLGDNPIKHPLKLDARNSGQAVPEGITSYGPNDFRNWTDNFHRWPIVWHIDKVSAPSTWRWPIPEAYFDVHLFVAQNEYTVDRWAGNVLAWGYLDARK